jgi:antitoxin CcdA
MRMVKSFNDSARPFRRDEAQPKRRLGEPAKPARKRATNVSIDEEILAEAKKLGINLSQTLETELRELVRQAKIDRWSEENKAAIDSYNRFIAENGIWSEEYRKW